jgi:hypothetical protein
MKNITITNNKTLFTYHGESLDLINPPDTSNNQLYALYNSLINSTLAIYGSSRVDGSIPVFWTKIDNRNKLSRIADKNSTLQKLENNKSYYIVILDNSSFPLTIPKPIDIQDISARSCYICTSDDIDCCSQLSIQSGNYSDVILSNEYSSNVYVILSGLKPDTKYNYSVSPVLSNWPAKMYPLSGFIERSGPTDKENNLNANLEFMFSYISKDGSGNIAKNIDVSNKKIFSILDFNVWQDGCDSVIKDTINISSSNLGSLTGIDICPSIKFNSDPYFVTNSGSYNVIMSYSGLDITKNNYYYISSNNANWPSRISSTSGKIIPEYIYKNTSSGKLYGSGVISLGFKFSDTSIPTPGFANLAYTLDSNYQEQFIKDNIYCSLNATVTTPVGCVSGIGTTTIICNDCLPNNEYNCINNASINIFESTNTYPINLVSSRPGAEKTIPIQCCHDDRQIVVNLSNLCPNELYDYKFSGIPNDVLLSSTSGYIGVPSGDGQIGTLINIGDNEAVNLTCTVTHRDTQKSISDSIILRCDYCRWNKIKDLNEIYTAAWSAATPVPSYAASSPDGSTMMVAIPSGYIYRSTDHGINWERLSNNGAKAWSSVDCAEYLGSNIWFFSTYVGNSSGTIPGTVYASLNNGDSLIETPSLPSGYNTNVESTDTGSVIIVGTYNSGIKTSIDLGTSWTDLNFLGSQRKRCNNISINNSADKIFLSYTANVASTNWAVVTANNFSGGYLRSLDSGTTWEEKRVPFISGSYSLVKYSKDGSTLVAINGAGADEFIYVSNDDGESWFPKQYETLATNVNNFYVSNNGQHIVLLGSDKIYKSKNSGDDWTKYTITGSNDILSMAHSSDMSLMTTVSRNNNIYSLHLYDCPADRT